MITILAFGMPAAPEWIFIGILALVLLGPKKLPELARGIGKALGELQKAKEDFRREISGVPPLPKIEPQSGKVAQSGHTDAILDPTENLMASTAPTKVSMGKKTKENRIPDSGSE
jgi:sec-independent protein translocase protein TatA